MKNQLTISRPKATLENGTFTLSAELSAPFSDCCFYSLPEEFMGWVDPCRSDCFMVGLLYTAMFDGMDLHVDGLVSEKLLFTLNVYVIPMLNGLDPRLKKIQVSAAETSNVANPEAVHTGTGFSGGVDSFYTLLHRGLQAIDTPNRFRIDTLFFFNVGAHGMGKGNERQKWLEDKFQRRFEILKPFADECNFPFIPINSNLHTFHQTGHLQTDTLASISAALFASARLAYYYLGSPGYTYYTQIRCPNTQNSEIALINDLILPHLSSESFLPIADGGDASRSGKTAEIANNQYVQKYLNVCGNANALTDNCSSCFKCRRTMLTLDILGKLADFASVFDLSKFSKREKRRYIADVLNHRNKDLFSEDICELAATHNYCLSAKTSRWLRLYMRFTKSRLFARLQRLKKWLQK